MERAEGPGHRPIPVCPAQNCEKLGKLRPGAEAALEGAVIEFSQVMVGAAGGDGAVPANSAAPIFEKFAVLEAQV